jgi:diguanylate cyclase (GGDEF)-like protein/PAS domain S-box-containing protein
MPTFRLPVSRVAPALYTVAAGLGLTAIVFSGVRYLEHDRAEREFRHGAMLRIETVKEEMLVAVDLVKTMNQFFQSRAAPDRQQFRSFAAAMLAMNPHIRALSFQRMLRHADRTPYEAALRKTYPDFAIGQWIDGKRSTQGPMPNYRVVDYLEPMQGNQAAFGLDVSLNLGQADAMQRARDTGLASASALLLLPQEPESQRSFLLMMPVYRQGALPQDVQSRRRAVLGYTTASIRSGTLVETALRERKLGLDAKMGLDLFAADSADERALAFHAGNGQAMDSADSFWPPWLFYDRPRGVSQTFNVAGKSWHLAVSGQARWFALDHLGSPIVLMAGLIATLGGAGYRQALGQRLARRRKLGRERAARLRAASALLAQGIGPDLQEAQARRLRERANGAIDHAVMITGAQESGYLIEQVDAAFERITGYSAPEVLGRNCSFLWGDDRDQPDLDEIRAAPHRQRTARLTLRLYRKDGTLFLCGVHLLPVKQAPGRAAHFVAALYDLSAIAHYLKELQAQASRDAVTGLPNQCLLQDRLTQAIAYVHRYSDPLWVVEIDFTGGADASQAHGAQGDTMMWRKVGAHLQSAVRVSDTVARLAGGEFVLLLAGRRDETLSQQAVLRLLASLKQPLTVADCEIRLGCSAGVAIYPHDGDDSETLMANACTAMRQARTAGDALRFYSLQPAPALPAA